VKYEHGFGAIKSRIAHRATKIHHTLIYSVILSLKISGIRLKSIARSELSSCPHAAFWLSGSAYQRKAPEPNDDDYEHTAP
jgi:hypothetical protein